MMDLTLCDGGDGGSPRLLEPVSRLEDTWPMDEEDDCESQKHGKGDSEGVAVGLRESFGEAGTGQTKAWHGHRRAGVRELYAVPAST